MKNITILLVLLISTGMFYSCGNTEDLEDDSFETRLTISGNDGNASSVFSRGETLQFEICIENLGDEVRSLQFNTGERYDVEVYNSENVLIWNLNYGKNFHSALESITFDPYEIKTVNESWDLNDNDGTPIDVGKFSAYIVWKTADQLSGGPYAIEITE